MPNINLATDEIVGLFTDRLKNYWDADKTAIELFEQYWERMVDDGCFDGRREFTISEIVDNDWVNNLTIIYKGEDYWDACVTAHDNGVSEVCDNDPDDHESADNIVYILEASTFDADGDLVFLVADY